MSADEFYLKSDVESASRVYLYRETVMKPKIHYEYIINRQFYLSAHVGYSALIKGGLYTKKRKELKIVDEEDGGKASFFHLDRFAVPFFNVGVSYSLFK